MKLRLGIIVLSLFNLLLVAQEHKSASEFQEELIEKYQDPEESPVRYEEDFEGLKFFPIDESYSVNANFTPIKDGQIIRFKTSTKRIANYKAFGKLNFELKGVELELIVYQSYPKEEGEYADHLFLPFKDLTNGDGSYGGGRYLDLSLKDTSDGEIILDFNKAYNPYCAYSAGYSCPIPPRNNDLDVRIEAGVAL